MFGFSIFFHRINIYLKCRLVQNCSLNGIVSYTAKEIYVLLHKYYSPYPPPLSPFLSISDLYTSSHTFSGNYLRRFVRPHNNSKRNERKFTKHFRLPISNAPILTRFSNLPNSFISPFCLSKAGSGFGYVCVCVCVRHII